MSHLTSKFKSTPTYTFKARNQTITSSNRDEQKPSPFHYDANPNQLSKLPKPLGKFNHSPRMKDAAAVKAPDLPGPGAYESSSSVNLGSFHKGETLKRGQKRFYEGQRLTPGPNHYDHIEDNSKSLPKYSFFREKRSKEQTHSVSYLPSPNSYHPNPQPREPSSSFSIGQAKRKENILPTRSPGPGAYIQERQFITNTSFNQKPNILPRAKRMKSTSSLTVLPAPNSYTSQSFIEQNFKKQKGFTCQKRYSCKQLETPSPIDYHNDALVHRYDVKVGFARSERKFLASELRRSGSTPGPGSHQIEAMENIKFKSLNGSKFPKSKLTQLLEDRPTNKLGFINPEKLDFSKRSIPKYTIPMAKARPDETKPIIDKIYDPTLSNKRSQGSFKIPLEKRMIMSKTTNVGPGYYNTQITTVVTRKIKFPKQKRRTFMDEAIQGKLKLFRDESYENREEFPNPPKYMNVHKKLAINDNAIRKY